MTSEQRWGHSVWVWWALAASAVASIALLLLSLTVQGRIFSVMLLIFEAGVALTFFVRWARAEREWFDVEAGGPGGVDDGLIR